VASTQRAVEAGGTKATAHIADVSDAHRMAELPDEVTAHHGTCHILVNNAGVVSMERFADQTLDDVRWMVGINVFGVLHGCHYFLPVLREADEAHIVNVSSMAAFAGIPLNASYSLTKGAVRSFTEALRAELIGTSIGVSARFPGAVGTDIMDRARGSHAARVTAFGKTRYARYLRRPPEAAARQIVRAIEHEARMGHNSVQMTLDRYGHLFPELDAQIAIGLDDVYRASLVDLPRASVSYLEDTRRTQRTRGGHKIVASDRA
jgi:short-subunit dehydrogenase